MKQKLLLLLLLCLGAVAKAQTGGIEGVVVDEKNKPLRYAFVQVTKNGIIQCVAVTNSKGKFLIEPLRIGFDEWYDVTVRLDGYVTEVIQGVYAQPVKPAKLLVVMSRPQPKPESEPYKSIKGMHDLRPVAIRAPRYEKPLIEHDNTGGCIPLGPKEIEPLADSTKENQQQETTVGVLKVKKKNFLQRLFSRRKGK